MHPSFEHALKARLMWMQVRAYGRLGFHQQAREIAQETYQLVWELALNEAFYPRHYGGTVPPMIADIPRLAALYMKEWHLESRETEALREEIEASRRRKQAIAHAEDCIERNDWNALCLPTPEVLSEQLYTGEGIRVAGHYLHYDEGLVWMDNPYGVEGGLGQEPSVKLCRQFLTRVAKGGMYGPEP